MKKLTMQALADEMGVSRITVWKALSQRSGVSPALRQKILSRAQEAGMLEAPPAEKPKRVIAAAVSRPESSAFWMQIIHHLAKELAKHGAGLMYVYIPTRYTEGYALPPALREQAEAFLVLNVYDETLLRMMASLKTPRVFLDTVPSLPAEALGGDLVILESREPIRRIAGRLLDGGIEKLGFIGDAMYARTNLERWLGFQDAHRERGLMWDERLCLTGRLGIDTYYPQIKDFLDGLDPLPGALVCASDFIVSCVRRYFRETGRPVPARFVLTGYDNDPEYREASAQITTVNVDTASLGQRLAQKLLFLSEHPDAPAEVSFVSARVLYRGALAEPDQKEI